MKNMINGQVSHWVESTSDTPRRENRPFPTEPSDLVIIGAGLTGLWTAYYAAKRHPDWTITVIESNTVGYGASGRNGGWLSPLLPGNRAVYTRNQNKLGRNGQAAVNEFQREMSESIRETLRILESENIDADQHQSGHLQVATTEAGLERAKAAYRANLANGYPDNDLELLSASAVKSRVNIAGAVGGLHYRTTARIHPAKLVQGLASTVEAMGVQILEHTRAHHIKKGAVSTNRGLIRGTNVLSCLESYSGSITCDAPGFGPREVIPVNSAMVVTEPLSDAQWESIGWQNEECLNDAAHTFVYAQRTKDGRIAIGGRGTPYRFNSGTAGDGAVDSRTVASLARRLKDFFPDHNLRIDHAWKGTIGVTRDWCAGIFFDENNRIGTARGFAGHGVTATNLAARTLLDRIDKEPSNLVRLPWNNHNSGKWEREPIRYLGVHTMYRLFGVADAHEEFTHAKDTSIIAKFGSRLAGLHE